MNLGQLHQYLGELIEAGTDRSLPVVVPGLKSEALPQELSEAMAIEGAYEADPAPLAKGYTEHAGAVLLLHGVSFGHGHPQSHTPLRMAAGGCSAA